MVIRGLNDDEIMDFVQFTADRKVDVRFIEYMPFTGNEWNNHKMVPFSEMLINIKNHFSNVTALSNKPNDTSKVSMNLIIQTI